MRSMKRAVIPRILILMAAGLLLSGISDTSAPDNEVTSSEADNSDSASATITITWTTAALSNE